MSKEDIEKAQRDAEAHAADDKKKKEAIEAKNHLENTIYQAEKMPDEYKDKISDEDKETIKKAVAEAKESLEKYDEDKDKLEEATKALNDAIMPIGAKMYQQASEDAKKDDSNSNNKDGDTVEGEVVDK
jgi:molecular chaperone DnaK